MCQHKIRNELKIHVYSYFNTSKNTHKRVKKNGTCTTSYPYVRWTAALLQPVRLEAATQAQSGMTQSAGTAASSRLSAAVTAAVTAAVHGVTAAVAAAAVEDAAEDAAAAENVEENANKRMGVRDGCIACVSCMRQSLKDSILSLQGATIIINGIVLFNVKSQ